MTPIKQLLANGDHGAQSEKAIGFFLLIRICIVEDILDHS